MLSPLVHISSGTWYLFCSGGAVKGVESQNIRMGRAGLWIIQSVFRVGNLGPEEERDFPNAS